MEGLNSLKKMLFGDLGNEAPRPVYPKVNKPETEKRGKKSAEHTDAPVRTEGTEPVVAKTEKIEVRPPEKTCPYTAEQLREGFKMSVILGEPLGKRGYVFRGRR